jgi:hypothetical protein
LGLGRWMNSSIIYDSIWSLIHMQWSGKTDE